MRLIRCLLVVASATPVVLAGFKGNHLRRQTWGDGKDMQSGSADVFLSTTIYVSSGPSTMAFPAKDQPSWLPSKDKPSVSALASASFISNTDKTTTMSSATKDNNPSFLTDTAKDTPTSISLPSQADKTMVTALSSKDDKSTSPLNTDKGSSTPLPSKDDKTSSTSVTQASLSIPLKDQSTTSTIPDKDKYSASSVLSLTQPQQNKPTSASKSSASIKTKTPGGPVIVYSITLTAPTVPTFTTAGLSSKPENPNLLTTGPSTKETLFPSSPSLTVLSTLPATTRFEFVGYEVVPSPSSISGLPNKDKFLDKTSSAIPVWTQELLGNAYGGGFIATPSLYVTKLPYPSAPSEGVPPGYGSSKLEVTIVAGSNPQMSGGKDNKTTIIIGGPTPSHNPSTAKTEKSALAASGSGGKSSLSTIYVGGPEVMLTVVSGSPVILPTGTSYEDKSSKYISSDRTTVTSSSSGNGPKSKSGDSGQAPYSYALPLSSTSENPPLIIGSPTSITYSMGAPFANSSGPTNSESTCSTCKSEEGAQATKGPSIVIGPAVATESNKPKTTSIASFDVGPSASAGDVNTGASFAAGVTGSPTSLGGGTKSNPTDSNVTGPSPLGIEGKSSLGGLTGGGQPSSGASPVFENSGLSSKKETNGAFPATIDKGSIIAPTSISASAVGTDKTATTQVVAVGLQVPSMTPATAELSIISPTRGSPVVTDETATLISPAAANAGSSGSFAIELPAETSAAFIAGVSSTVTVGGISTKASTVAIGSSSPSSLVLGGDATKINQTGSMVNTGTNGSLGPAPSEQIPGTEQPAGSQSTLAGNEYESKLGSPQVATSLQSDKSKPALGGIPVSTFSTGGPGVQGGLPAPQGPIPSTGTQVSVSSGLYTSAGTVYIGNSSVSVLLNPTAVSQFQGSAMKLSLGFGVGLIGVLLVLIML